MKKIFYIIIAISLFTHFTNAQWVQQPEPATGPMYNIDFVNRWTGWATGANSVILKTTDGGANWFSQSIDLGYPKNLYGLDMVDENTGYIAGWFETILKTTNGGTNWNIISNIPSNDGNSNHACFFIDVQTGWISSSGGRVLKTTNSGLSWDSVFINGISSLRCIQFLNSQTGWICGIGGVLYQSTNGGATWINGPLLTTANLLSIHFININTGWTVSEQGRRIFRTTNAGVKWDTLAVLSGAGTDFLYYVHFVNPLTGWTGGSNSLLYKTIDGGLNWYMQSVPAPLFIRGMSFYNDSIGWATGGNQGVIIHTTNGGTYVGINPVSNTIPQEFKLFQNYPNPFNPATNIEFEISEKGIYTMEMYDILGRKIQMLFNEFIDAGKYKFTFSASDLSSGTYFYKLSSANYTDVKKCLLIK